MKAFKLNFITLFTFLFFISSFQLSAQRNMDVEVTTKDDKVTIIKKYTDKNGVKTIEKIVKDIDEMNEVEKELMVIEGMEDIDLDIDLDGSGHHNFNFEFDEDGEHNIFEWDGDGESLDKMILKLKEKGMSFNFDHDGNYNSFFSCDNNKYDEAFLGVVIGNSGRYDEGVYIQSIVDNSAAEIAGLERDDIITAIGGESINSFSDLSDKLDEYKPGDNVTIDYVRANTSATTNATLKTRERPTTKAFSFTRDRREPCKPFIGVYLHSGHNERGVKITDVIDNTPASEVGMEAGDYITAIDGVPVTSHRHTLRERDKHSAGDFFTITFTRDGRSQEVEAQFPACDVKEELKDKIKEATPEPAPNLNTSPTIKQVSIPDNTLQLDGMGAYPNPTTGRIYVQFRAEVAPVMITVTDMLGREILKEEISDFDGFYNKELNLKDATPGTLLLNIFQNNKVFTEKIVKTGAY